MVRSRSGSLFCLSRFSLSVAVLVGALAARASAQLVVGADPTGTQSIWLIDVTGVEPNRALVTSSGTMSKPWGMAADEDTQTLYWNNGGTLFKAAYTTSGALTVETVASMTLGGSAINFTGLAYDTLENKLYGFRNITTIGFYEINTVDGTCALVTTTPASTDFGGFDYDPVTDAFYGVNDGTGLSGRGLYRISKPLSGPTYTFLVASPNSDTDIDGLAVGDGKAYFVNDNSTQNNFVYNLTTLEFEAPIPVPTVGAGTFSAGAWAPGLMVPFIGTNLRITKTDSPDPVVPPGGNITYTITVTNLGPDPATGVTVSDTLPGNVTFVSVGAPGVHDAGVITANIGNLAANGSVAFNLVVQSPATPGTVSNTATVTGNETDPQSSNNSATAITTVRNPQANLGVSITDPADCTIDVGGTVTYTVTVSNPGPETANNVVLVSTLPNDSTFISSNPAGTAVGDTLTTNLGSISAGGNAVLTVDVSPTAAVILNFSASATADEEDPTPGNNSDSETTQILGGGPTTATIKGILSTIASSPTSDVPDLAGKFAANGLLRPYRSPNGTKWIMDADTDLATTIDEIIVVGTIGGSFSVVVQEGVTTLPESDTIGLIDNAMGINDAGQFGFCADTNAATTSDEVAVKWDGTQFVTVAREGSACPPIAGATWGATRDSASVQQDGTMSFYSNLANAGGTATDTGYFTDDGNTIVAREGTTIPTGQGGGTTFFYGTLQTGATEGAGLFLNATGTRFCAITTLVGAPTTSDRVLIVDNDVKIQEGFVIPGSSFGSPVGSTSPITNVMESNGDWLSYGSNADGQDWVVRNGVVVAATGDELTPGSGLFWGDSSFAQTFFMAAGNNNGDYVVGGVFNGPVNSNAALVMNGTTIVARENDPIDLDNNGLFDDGVFLRTFLDDRLFMTNNEVVCVVRLRDANAALCGATDTDIGQALIRIPIGGTGPAPCCKGDMDGSANVDAADVNEFIAQLVLGVGGDPCPLSTADVNNDAVVDGLDISSMVDRILANGGAGTACP